MSFETLHNVVRGRFETQVVDNYDIPTQYDNEKEKPPQLDNVTTSSALKDSTWCRFTILDGETNQVETGATKNFRTTGLAIAQIFQPLGIGDKPALQVADIVASAFRSVTESGVTFRTPSIQRVGRRGKWWQVNVQCPFYSDLIV